jgi:hypothetical protein
MEHILLFEELEKKNIVTQKVGLDGSRKPG